MPDRFELLAPAGSMQALHAAIAAGADAVYLGAQSHGARASVGFDDLSLEQAIRLSHLHGVRVYVTVNTLMKEHEIPQVQALLETLSALRADAVIVQDFGLVQIIRQSFPDMVIHASTQMSIHNAAGASLLRQHGISRVVLARECGLDDIRSIAQTGIEAEVFIHGALCIAQSGQCQFSSHIGRRSGNRGRCAQPCRLQYRYKDQDGALLSPKDQSMLEHLPRLMEAGAASFKIEGRLKRPEYVYIVTKAYRYALDQAIKDKPVENLDSLQDSLARVFSRGFTKGHAFGEQDNALMSIDNVGHQGVLVAKINKLEQRQGFFLAYAKMQSALFPGDGLQIRGRIVQDMIYSGPQIAKNEIAVLRLRKEAFPGDFVYRTLDEKQLSGARQEILLPKIPADAALTLEPGAPARLEVSAKGCSVSVLGDMVSNAQNSPMDQSSAKKQVAKTGETPFELKNFQFISSYPSFIASSSLNQLRRTALEMLEEALIKDHTLPVVSAAPATPSSSPFQACSSDAGKPRLYALATPEQDRDRLYQAGADQVVFYLNQYRKEQIDRQFGLLKAGDILLLPRQLFDDDLQKIIRLARQHHIRIMADNLGQLYQQKSCIMAGDGIPAWNHFSLQSLQRMGVQSVLLSRELTLEEISSLPHNILELILPVFGRGQLMQLNHCPERVRLGLSKMRIDCRLCQQGKGIQKQVLTDRFDCHYPLVPTHFDRGCLITLFHHKPLHLDRLAPRMSWLIDLRLETTNDAMSITSYYAQLLSGLTPSIALPYPPEPGRALLGVE